MKKGLHQNIYLMLFIALLFLPKIGLSEYYLRLVDVALVYIVLALGLNIMVGFIGQMSFAHAGFFAIGSYTAAILAVRWGLPFWLGVIAAGLVTAIFAVLVGLPTLKLETKYLSMATIGFSEIIRLVLLNTEKLSYGADGIANIPYPEFLGFTFNTDVRLYYLLLIFVVLAIVAAYRLKNSRVGRSFEAIKENTLGAELMGVPTTYTKVLAFALSAVFTGVGGALYAHLMAYIHPDVYIFGESAKALCMVYLGGVGSVAGPVFGAVILTFLPEFLRGLQDYYMIIYAAAVIVIVLWAPTGLVGVFKHVVASLKSKKGRDSNVTAPNA